MGRPTVPSGARRAAPTRPWSGPWPAGTLWAAPSTRTAPTARGPRRPWSARPLSSSAGRLAAANRAAPSSALPHS
eukprot:8150638-Alexandrium_andersonii.AAC.1